MKWFSSLGVLVAAVALAFLKVQTANAQSASSETWQVEISMYSGLPNPTYTLSTAEIAQVKSHITSAPALPAASVANDTILPSILGYRGMIVIGTTSGKQVVEHTEVSGSKIYRKAGARALLDGKPSGLERVLLTLALSKSAITADQGKYIGQQIP
jgi:hypothetical protein